MAVVRVVATWTDQLRPSLQAFALGLPSAQSGITGTLTHSLYDLDKGPSSRKLFLASPDPGLDPDSAC